MKSARIMIAAPGSGSGKTFLTCGILQALLNRGRRPASFKCGPDYIDPMFHTKVLGVPSRNLDAFFCEQETLQYLYARQAEKADICIVEGVMGYYDGIGGNTTRASAYEVASQLRIPTVLLVDGKGASASLAALIKGFLEYRKDSMIRGIIFNRISPMMYPVLKELIERELPVRVLGYVKPLEKLGIKSRHLGLVTPEEIDDFQTLFQCLAEELAQSIDFEAMEEMAGQAEELPILPGAQLPGMRRISRPPERVKIGVARDEAFSFHYADNLELLEELGAELVFFSPMLDTGLPEGIRGLILCGGYPEVYAAALEKNAAMRAAVKFAVEGGMPTIAECGGFLYLQEELRTEEGKSYRMCGVKKGRGMQTPRLQRFGYINLLAVKDSMLLKKGETIPAHEFHYFDCEANGEDFRAEKASGSRGWDCGFGTQSLYAGFPHLYYYSYPKMIERFLERAWKWKRL